VRVLIAVLAVALGSDLLSGCAPSPPPTFLDACDDDTDCEGALTCERRNFQGDTGTQQCTQPCESNDDCDWGDCSLGAIALGTPQGSCYDDGFCGELQCR